MSALDELEKKEQRTELENAIVLCSEVYGWETTAQAAADKLAALQQERDEAVKLLKELSGINELALEAGNGAWLVDGSVQKRIDAFLKKVQS